MLSEEKKKQSQVQGWQPFTSNSCQNGAGFNNSSTLHLTAYCIKLPLNQGLPFSSFKLSLPWSELKGGMAMNIESSIKVGIRCWWYLQQRVWSNKPRWKDEGDGFFYVSLPSPFVGLRIINSSPAGLPVLHLLLLLACTFSLCYSSGPGTCIDCLHGTTMGSGGHCPHSSGCYLEWAFGPASGISSVLLVLWADHQVFLHLNCVWSWAVDLPLFGFAFWWWVHAGVSIVSLSYGYFH